LLALLPGLLLAGGRAPGASTRQLPLRAAVAVGATVVGFLLTTPFFFADWQRTVDSLTYQANRTGDELAAPLSHPEIFVWYFTQAVPVVMGLIEAGLAYAGLALALRRRPTAGLILGAFVLTFFAGISLDDIYYYRWGIQAYTALSLTGAYAIVELARLTMSVARSHHRAATASPSRFSSTGGFPT
jgi:hypothetical protein